MLEIIGENRSTDSSLVLVRLLGRWRVPNCALAEVEMAFLQTYSGQNVDWSQAVEEVENGNGEIFPGVIRSVRKGSVEGALTYGFFYRLGDEYWDLYFDRAHKPKTTPSIERVMLELVNLYGDNAYSFMIPVLDEKNLISRGSLDPRIHRLYWLERDL